jgi:hypothetical protein
MMPLSAGVVPFMIAEGGSLYTCQKHAIPKSAIERLMVKELVLTAKCSPGFLIYLSVLLVPPF